MCCETDVVAHGHHLQNALNSLYSRFKTLSLGSSLLSQDKFEMVESRLGSLPLVDRAASVIEAVDEKLESAIAAALYLKGVQTTIVTKAKSCKRKVSKAELRKAVEAMAVALGTRIYLTDNPTVKQGTRNFHRALRFYQEFSLARVKLSSFECIETTAYLTKMKTGNCQVVPEAVLDSIFSVMFGVSPAKQLFVHMCDGSTKVVGVKRTHTVRCLKRLIKEREGIPLDELCLLYNGKELCDKQRLSDECKVQDSGTVHVMLRVAGGMMIKVKSSDEEGFMEINVDPSDTVESLMRQLQQKSPNDAASILELCLPDQPSAWDIITQLAAMINQRSEKLLETCRNWHALSCSVADPNFGDLSGLEACMQHYSMIASVLDDITVSINRIEEPALNTVKVWWTMAAVMVAPVLGIQPNGMRFKISGVSTHRIDNGCIQSSEWSWDAVGFMAQAGRPQPQTSPGSSRANPNLQADPARDSDSEYNGSSGNGSPLGSSLADEWSPQFPVEPSDDFDILDLDLLGPELFQLPPCHNLSVKQEHCISDTVPAVADNALALCETQAKIGIKRDTPAHGDVVCLQYLEYECGYCKVRKVSTSTGGDGRVRIRCECGGKHSDGQPRMHAKWKLCRELSRRDQMLKLENTQPALDAALDEPWNCDRNKRAKTTEFGF